jgi:hypothetical protein
MIALLLWSVYTNVCVCGFFFISTEKCINLYYALDFSDVLIDEYDTRGDKGYNIELI